MLRRPWSAVYSSRMIGARRGSRVGRWLWGAVLLVSVVPGLLAARGVDDDLDASYARRIEYVDDWGHRYPGDVPGSDEPLDDLGIVAGMMLQTTWQKDFGRDAEPMWRLINAGLTAQPYRLSLEFRQNGNVDCRRGPFVSDHPTRDVDRAPLTRGDVCRAWRAYFMVGDAIREAGLGGGGVAHSIAQGCLWDAHTKSIVHELWQHRRELRGGGLAEQERRFWANWIGAVFTLAEGVYPTTAIENAFFSARLMPGCGPLGDEACRLDRFSGAQLIFLAALTARDRSVDRLIEEFVRRREQRDLPCPVGGSNSQHQARENGA